MTCEPATGIVPGTFDSRLDAGVGDLWAVVLAGGEGVRLRPLVRRLFGEDRPKQFARLLGPRSLLGDTLERVGLEIPRERTVVVTTRHHGPYIEEEFRERARPILLDQPDDRGTAASVLYPASWIARRDPEAVLAVFPSDHFIPDGARFMRHVLGVAELVARDPARAVLLGARATQPETEYGWVRPGPVLGLVGEEPVCAIEEFREKPEAELARRCLARGDLWNTFVFVAPARLLLELGRRHAAELTRRIERMADFLGGPLERWAVSQAYAHAPRVNFSRAILQACPDRLAVARLPRLTWSDWGTPERVIESLRTAGLTPGWLGALRPEGAVAEEAGRLGPTGEPGPAPAPLGRLAPSR